MSVLVIAAMMLPSYDVTDGKSQGMRENETASNGEDTGCSCAEPAAGQIGIEYLKQSEREENQGAIEKMLGE